MKESSRDKIYAGIVTGILIILAIIAIVPLLNVLAMSFSSRSAADRNIVTIFPVEATLDSWRYILKDNGLWRSTAISIAATFLGTIFALAITGLMAYPLSKSKFKLGSLLMIYVVGTMIFKAPTVPYFLTLRAYGLYNSFWVLVLPHILSAYNLAIMRTFFKGFPEEVEEAARIDGCGAFQTLFRVVLPSSKAVLATLALFYGVTIWNQFQHPMMFIAKTDLFPLQMKIRQLINGGGDFAQISAISNRNYTEATLSAATVVFAVIPVIAVYPFIQKYFAQGAMLGSVKG